MSVQVHVALKGSLGGRGAGATKALDLPEGADTAVLLTACDLDRRGCIVVVNGAVTTGTTRLRSGDRVQVYPAQAGG